MKQRIVPMLAYEDGPAALDWLVEVFGFKEETRWLDEEGRLSHGEVSVGDQKIMLSSAPRPEYESARTLRSRYAPAGAWLDTPYIVNGVLVHVDDLDGLFARIQAHGGEILGPIEDGFPGRRFRCADLEGHRWFFFQHSADLDLP